MLYTISKADDSAQDLLENLELQTKDAVLLWQDGVNLTLKNLPLLKDMPALFALKQDVLARGLLPYYQQLAPKIKLIDLDELVSLTEIYHPQFAF